MSHEAPKSFRPFMGAHEVQRIQRREELAINIGHITLAGSFMLRASATAQRAA
jgi:hypothetical protein